MQQSFDEKNRDLLININGEMVHRDEAGISPFDSAVQGGDAVWEGLRLYGGRIFKLREHLDRLRSSALALAFREFPTHDDLLREIRRCLEANGMTDGAHMRLTLTRGPKVTSGMSPSNNKLGPCLIVLAEWKPPVYDAGGIRLVTSSVRRNSPQTVDSGIHHNNLINNILAKIEAEHAGADDALMLDVHGFVAETNATNVFLVKRGELLVPWAESCLPGITRGVVLRLAREDGMPVRESHVTPAQVYTADEMFVTGTMGELTPVLEVDGRTIGVGEPGPVTGRLRELYGELARREGEPLPFA